MAHNIFKMAFASLYQLLLNKVERKGRTKEELNQLIYWLTGFDEEGLNRQIKSNVTVETFYSNSPQINPNAELIKGTICGCKIEEITDPLMQKIRWLDKLVDDLAKGKSINKILK